MPDAAPHRRPKKLTEHKPSAVRHTELDHGRRSRGSVSGVSDAFHRERAEFLTGAKREEEALPPPQEAPSTKTEPPNVKSSILRFEKERVFFSFLPRGVSFFFFRGVGGSAGAVTGRRRRPREMEKWEGSRETCRERDRERAEKTNEQKVVELCFASKVSSFFHSFFFQNTFTTCSSSSCRRRRDHRGGGRRLPLLPSVSATTSSPEALERSQDFGGVRGGVRRAPLPLLPRPPRSSRRQ